MTRKSRRNQFVPLLIALTFAAGGVVGWWARGRPAAPETKAPFPTDVTIGAIEPTRRTETLNAHALQLPIAAADPAAMRGQFGDRRDGGRRGHEAVDIMAPRNTPIHAVDEGTIVKLFASRAGGTTIYEFDRAERFCYYYAHLESYAPGLHEGQRVSRGDVIGFVGSSGNASPKAPHLHFAIVQLNADRHWWEGTPIDPFPAFQEQGTGDQGSGNR